MYRLNNPRKLCRAHYILLGRVYNKKHHRRPSLRMSKKSMLFFPIIIIIINYVLIISCDIVATLTKSGNRHYNIENLFV